MPTINDAHTIIFQDSKGSDILGDEFGLLRSSMDRNAMLLDQYIRDQKRREDDSLVRQTTPRDERSRPDEMRQMASMMSRGVQHVRLENAMSDIVYPLYERMLIVADESSTRQERYDREHFFYYSKMVEALDGINEHNEDVSRGLVLTFHYMRNHPIMATGKAFIGLIKGAVGVVKTAGNVLFGIGDQRTVQEKQLDVQKRTLHFIRTGEAKARYRSPLSILKEEGVAGTIAGIFAKRLAQDRENRRAAGEEVGSGFLGLGRRADFKQSEFITLQGRSGKVGGTDEYYPKMIEQLDEANKKLFSLVYFMSEQTPALLEDFKVRERSLVEMGDRADKDGVWKAQSIGKFNAIESFLGKLTILNEEQLEAQNDIGTNTKKTWWETKKARLQALWLAIKGGITSLLSSPLVIAGIVAVAARYLWNQFKKDGFSFPKLGFGGEDGEGMSTGAKIAAGVGVGLVSVGLMKAGITAAVGALMTPAGLAVIGTGIATLAAYQGGKWLKDNVFSKLDETTGETKKLKDFMYSELAAWEMPLAFVQRAYHQAINLTTGFFENADGFFSWSASAWKRFTGVFRRKSDDVYNATSEVKRSTKDHIDGQSGFISNIANMFVGWKDSIVRLFRRDKQDVSEIRVASQAYIDDKQGFISNISNMFVGWKDSIVRLFRRDKQDASEVKTASQAYIDEKQGFISSISNMFVGWKDSLVGLFRREGREVNNEFDAITSSSEQVTRSWNDKFQQFRASTSAGWNARSDALDRWGTDWISNFDQNKETVNKHIGRVTQILQSAIPFFRQNRIETSSISDEISNEMENSMGRLETAFSSITGFFGGIRDRIRGLIKSDDVDAVVPSMTDENLDSVISRMSQLPISPITSVGSQSRQQMPISSITSEESRSFAPVERSSVFKNPDMAQGEDSPFDPDRFKDPEVARLLKSIDGHLNNMRRDRLDIIPFGNEPDALMNLNLMGE